MPHPSPQTSYQGTDLRTAQGGWTFPPRDIDLTTLNATLPLELNIQGMDRISVRLQAGTFGTAVVSLEASLDGTNWTLLGEQFTTSLVEQAAISTDGFPIARMRVATNDAGASTATAFIYTYQTGR